MRRSARLITLLTSPLLASVASGGSSTRRCASGVDDASRRPARPPECAPGSCETATSCRAAHAQPAAMQGTACHAEPVGQQLDGPSGVAATAPAASSGFELAVVSIAVQPNRWQASRVDHRAHSRARQHVRGRSHQQATGDRQHDVPSASAVTARSLMPCASPATGAAGPAARLGREDTAAGPTPAFQTTARRAGSRQSAGAAADPVSARRRADAHRQEVNQCCIRHLSNTSTPSCPRYAPQSSCPCLRRCNYAGLAFCSLRNFRQQKRRRRPLCASSQRQMST